jgi:thiamine pyrophosphate-dependent acetolactate synthase large subunit-like protein
MTFSVEKTGDSVDNQLHEYSPLSDEDQRNEEAAGCATWGSDVVADFLRSTGVPYLALNPGSSYRGLHDSLVNHLGASDPGLLLCLHEEHAVAIAHGWAKVTGEPMLVAVHANVGLMHATMALYNAWCDRVPMLVIGANGPLDAAKRRPWIDWVHTSADLPALVRPFLKWDDQPVSVEASAQSLARAWDVTRAFPQAPTLVSLDVSMQEELLLTPVAMPAITTGSATDTPVASAGSVARAVELLRSARHPVILLGRTSRNIEDWNRRIQLAEALSAPVITDLKVGAAFPTEHPLHVPGPGVFLGSAGQKAIDGADCILALDWVDVAGTLSQARNRARDVSVISATLDHILHNGWTRDHQARVEADVLLPTTADLAVGQLLAQLGPDGGSSTVGWTPAPSTRAEARRKDGDNSPIMLPELAAALRVALGDAKASLVRIPLGWNGDDWDFRHPLDFLGSDGGGGIGSGPGMLVGAALALRGTERLPIGILGDGDYMMGVQALWTAANQQIPMLAIVANNRSYFNDEVHQERVARERGRDVSRKWIGQRIDEPAPDLAGMARAQGLIGIGPVTRIQELPDALESAVSLLKKGHAVVIDVIVGVGYTPAMAEALVRD